MYAVSRAMVLLAPADVVLLYESMPLRFLTDVVFRILFFVILGRRYVLFVLVDLRIVFLEPDLRFLTYRVFLLLKRGILAGKRGCSWRETRTRKGAVVVFGIHDCCPYGGGRPGIYSWTVSAVLRIILVSQNTLPGAHLCYHVPHVILQFKVCASHICTVRRP